MVVAVYFDQTGRCLGGFASLVDNHAVRMVVGLIVALDVAWLVMLVAENAGQQVVEDLVF